MKSRNAILFTTLSAAVLVLFAADLATGPVSISLRDVMAALTGGECDANVRRIVLDIRLTKAVMSLLAGAALSVSGLQMQTMFRNPLAGPYVLGVSAGASFGVALFLLGAPLMGLTSHPAMQTLGTAGAAWIGAAAVLLLIMALGRRIKDIMVILILGMMLSSAVSAAVEIMQYLSNETALKTFVIWTMGSLGNVTTEELAMVIPAITLGMALSISAIKPMNMLLLGESYARTMGLNVVRTRRTVFLSTTLLAGTVTAFCGPIGFVGLAVPHLARMAFSSADHRTLLPASVLVGMVMLLLCDIIAKSLTLPINTITALMGIPVVVYIVIGNRNLFQ